MISLFPASDWALDAIVNLDIATPGLAGSFLRASAERRQVICAYLAARGDPEGSTAVGQLLLHGGHNDILYAAYGEVPEGLRGALARAGHTPWGREFYPCLFAILSNRSDAQAALLIQRLPVLTGPKLKAVEMLPPDLLHPRIVSRLDDLDRASDLKVVTSLIEQAGLDRRAFIRALLSSSDERMSKIIERWALRLPFPPSPLPMTNVYQPIRSGTELRRVAIRYRNCSRGYHAQALAGETAFGEFMFNEDRILVHLDRCNGVWIFSSAYGYRNRPVNRAMSDAAQAYAAQCGVPAKRQRSKAKELEALRRLGGMPQSW